MGEDAATAGDAKQNRRLLWRLMGILVAFWLVVGLVFGPKYFKRMGASWYVNTCKEQGGCWDVQAARCEKDRSKCPEPPGAPGGR